MFDGWPLSPLDYSFVPWGNAYYTSDPSAKFSKNNTFAWAKRCGGAAPPADCFTGKKLCQHGDPECQADTIEACAMYLYAAEPTAWTGFVSCFEGEQKSDPKYVGACARYYHMDATAITNCAANKTLADSLDVENAKKTAKLGPAKLGTPWVLMDGRPVPSKDLGDLLGLVCENWIGSDKKPEGCPYKRRNQTVEEHVYKWN